MSLRSLIDQTYKAATTTVKFNGNRARDVLAVELGSTLNDTLSTATITTLTKPLIIPESRIQVSQGYNKQEQLTFTGYVDTIEYDEGENTWIVSARDVLKKAMDTFLIQEIKFGQDISAGTFFYSTWEPGLNEFHVHEYGSLVALNTAHPETTGNYTNEGVFAHAVVQWMLVMCGFTEGVSIQVDNPNFFIGDISPVKFHLTSIYDAILQIANLIGWRIYADISGVCRFRKRPRNPSGYDTWTYTTKAAPFNLHKISKSETNTDLRNYIEVRGASGIRKIVQGASPYIGNTPYRGVLVSEELIDTQGIADYMAARIYNDLNRLKVTLNLEVDGNPYVLPGTTVDVRSKEANSKFLVESIQTSMNGEEGYRMSVTAVQYPGSPSIEEEPPPEINAVFTAVSAVSIGDPTYLIEFDGAASSSTRGAIVRYVWTWPDATTTDSTDSRAWWTIQDTTLAGGVDVSLTVYDEIGQQGTTTSGIDQAWLDGQVVTKYRHLYGALTTRGVGSLDGGAIWTVQTIPAISVAASNFGPGGVYVASGHAVFGCSDGMIYRTTDGCASLSGVFNTGSPVATIYIPELNSQLALAGCENGMLYQSVDAGVTWNTLHDFAFPIRDIKYAYTQFDNIVVVGSGLNNIYETFDAGANFVRRSFGIDATHLTDGAFTNYFAHTAGFVALSGGGAVELAFNGGVHPYVPTATVMIDRDDGIMLVDSTGQHWVYASGLFSETQYNSANLTRHMIRDGDVPILGYYATQSGISKSLDRNTTIKELYYPPETMPTGGWGKMVAYGPLASPITPGRIIMRASQVNNAVPIYNMSGVLIETSPVETYFVSTTQNSWISTGISTDGGAQAHSVTPGHFIFLTDGIFNAGRLSHIGIQASGFTLDNPFYTADFDGSPSILSAQFSKYPPQYGNVRIAWSHGSDIFAVGSEVKLATIQNFLQPFATTYIESLNTAWGLFRAQFEYFTQLGNNDTMAVYFAKGLISQERLLGSYSFTTGDWQAYEVYPEKFAFTDYEVKFPPHWYTIGRYIPDDTDNGIITSYAIDGVEGVVPKHGQMWSSYQYNDAYYYMQASGIYRVGRYGQGPPELIFTAPSGKTILTFSVTPAMGLRTDCGAAITGVPANEDNQRTNAVLTHYSTDAGDSWLLGPQASDILHGAFEDTPLIWYVAEYTRTT